MLSRAANTWRRALLKALVVQAVIVGFLSFGWFGWGGVFAGADNPGWFYVAWVLQFPASLLFTRIVGLVGGAFPDDAQSIEVAGAVVAVLQFVLLAVVIKKIKDYWLA